jgi:S-adenosylmethionine hydrolase
MEVRAIENEDYRLTSPGHTFDGRDLFAPAAAWLTRQQPFASFGRPIHDPVHLPIEQPTWEGSTLVGTIISVDRFGNLITNLTPDHVKEIREVTKRSNPLILIAGHTIDGLVGRYQEGDAQMPRALINSNGQLEIFLKESSAASLLQLGKKEAVRLT